MASAAFTVGMVFPTMRELKKAVDVYFASIRCGNRKAVCDRRRLKVVCMEHVECPFVLWAFKMKDAESVKITSLELDHTTALVESTGQRKRRTCKVPLSLLETVTAQVLDIAGGQAGPRLIQKIAKKYHGLDVDYHRAWRVKQRVTKIEHHEDGADKAAASSSTDGATTGTDRPRRRGRPPSKKSKTAASSKEADANELKRKAQSTAVAGVEGDPSAALRPGAPLVMEPASVPLPLTLPTQTSTTSPSIAGPL